MKANVGSADRMIRVIAGVGLIAAAFFALGATDMNPLGIVAGVVGLVLVVTGAVRFCPAYTIVGLSTCPMSK